MGIRVLRESSGSRTPGYSVKAGVSIVGGLAVTLDDANTIKLFVATATASPLGIALDSNVMFPLQNTADPTNQAGQGMDYTNYNRGGLISVLTSGAEVEVFDDGRSVGPFSATNNTFLLNGVVYAEAATGKLASIQDTTGERIGRVTSVTGTYAAPGAGCSLVVRFILEV
jgi:hypothetical protein